MADPKTYNPPKSDFFWGKGTVNSQGPFVDVRQRVAPGLFTEVDREWRAKWLKAQELSKREKAFHFYYLWDNPDFRKARLNPLRRVWQAPGEAFERALRPALGLQKAFMTKWFVGKSFWLMGTVWAIAYYASYNSADWTTKGGWKSHVSKTPTYPDNPHYPKKDPKYERNVPSAYYDYGFTKCNLELKTSTPLTP